MIPEEIMLKANILGGLNDYILNVIGNDDVTDNWLANGIPDQATEEDLIEIAEDEIQFAEIVYHAGYLINANAKGVFDE